MSRENYYRTIAEHYDREAQSYEQRLQNNQTVLKIRNDFRQLVSTYIQGENILDFGCGAGTDICFFAGKYPDKFFTGIDLSPKMIEQSQQKIDKNKLQNIKLTVGSIDHLTGQKFDFIYVFFGALNTVDDLNDTVDRLHQKLNEKGRILVTFVNKWYPMGMLAYLRRLKLRKAFERLHTTWWGYSEDYKLPSRTYYGRHIKKVFKKFSLLHKRGYSIFYPAWFQDRIREKLGPSADRLWRLDRFLSKTPLWSWGEYVLFVFEKKNI